LEVGIFANAGAEDTVFMTRNGYAVLMSTFAPMLLPIALSSRGFRRWVAGAGLAVVLGAILINASRGGWLASALGLFVFAVYFVFFARRKPSGFAVAVLILIAVLGAYRTLSTGVVDRLLGRAVTMSELEFDKSAQIRVLMMQKSWRMFRESPLFGAGAGRFTRTYVPLDLPRILTYKTDEYFNNKSSHNSYAQWLAEVGLVGSVPLAGLLVLLVVRGAGATARLVRHGELWAAGIYTGFIGMSAHLWVLSGITNTGTWLVYGLVAGVIVVDGWYRRLGLYQQSRA
jgi:O-antigen ligase